MRRPHPRRGATAPDIETLGQHLHPLRRNAARFLDGGFQFRRVNGHMQVRVSLDPHFRLLNLAFVVQFVDQDKQRVIALFPGQNLTAVVIMLFTGGDNVTPAVVMANKIASGRAPIPSSRAE